MDDEITYGGDTVADTTPSWGNASENTGFQGYDPMAFKNEVIKGFDATYNAAEDSGAAPYMDTESGSEKYINSGNLTGRSPAADEMDSGLFGGGLLSRLDKILFSKDGEMTKPGLLAMSAGFSVLGELFSGSKKAAAENAKKQSDAYTLNASTNATNAANVEAARQNALTSTSTAFGPTYGPAGLLNKPPKFVNLNKPNWKI